MPTPIISPISVVSVKVLLRKRLIGMSGSAARRSTATKAAANVAVAAPSPRMTDDVHA